MFETVVTILGAVVDVPHWRRLDSGTSVASFRLGSTARRFDKEQNCWSDGDSLYVRVSCWRQLADNVYRSVMKGDPIIVTGRLFTRIYDREGERRASYELDATGVGLDLNRGQASFMRQQPDTASDALTYEIVEAEAGADAPHRSDDQPQPTIETVRSVESTERQVAS